MLSAGAAGLVAATVAAAHDHLAMHVPPTTGTQLTRSPHPAAPEVGALHRERRTVLIDDTASAMGHPDGDLLVLGSPRISLWFELATTPLMPPIDEQHGHVGVAILVHHLDAVGLNEEVEVSTVVTAVEGRLVTFACHARVDGRTVAMGSHLRVVRDRS